MLSLSEAARTALEEALMEFGEEAEFVIYPFGEGGKILKGILNYEYGIKEAAIIDNGLANLNVNIEKVTWLQNHQEAVVLVASNRLDKFKEIRQALYANISKTRCIEVFAKVIWDEEYYPQLMRLSKIYAIGKDFVRVGNEHDGGYVMADDMPGGIAYSFGISDDPSWDLDMCGRGYEVFMYDHTVACPEQVFSHSDRLHFFKVGIADKCPDDTLKTLEALIKENGHENENDMILKMDVEGAEWGFLAMTESKILNKFRQIVLELHIMNPMEGYRKEQVLQGMEKLYCTHRLIHVHGNNWGGFMQTVSHKIPDTWEVTYVRKDLVGELERHACLPMALDNVCHEKKEEIVLGDWNKDFKIGGSDEIDLWERIRQKYYDGENSDYIYVIGDSHVSFFSGQDLKQYVYHDGIGICRPRIEPFRTFHLGPALAYNLGKYGTTTGAREKVEAILSSGMIPKGGKIMCVFGEIDIRVHVFKQAQQKEAGYRQVVDEIVLAYVEFLKFLQKDYDVYVWCPVASQSDDCYLDASFPRSGTQVGRNEATRYFIEQLQKQCSTLKIGKCLQIFSSLVNENLETEARYYGDPVHLSQMAWTLASKVFEEEKILVRLHS